MYSIEKLQRLSEWIEQHGLQTHIDTDARAITIYSSWVNVKTGEEGIEKTVVKTYSEARNVLGY